MSLDLPEMQRLKDAFGNERKRVYRPEIKYRTRKYRHLKKKKSEALVKKQDDLEIASVSSGSSNDSDKAEEEGENMQYLFE